MEKIQPEGVFVVGLLTVLGALTMGYMAFGSWTYLTNNALLVSPDPEALTIVALTGGFSVLLLADAILILRGVRVSWYLSLDLWIALLCYVVSSPLINWSLLPSVFLPAGFWPVFVVYLTACLVYFLTKRAREYFGT